MFRVEKIKNIQVQKFRCFVGEKDKSFYNIRISICTIFCIFYHELFEIQRRITTLDDNFTTDRIDFAFLSKVKLKI